jgi:hypothetical protein
MEDVRERSRYELVQMFGGYAFYDHAWASDAGISTTKP